MKSGLIAFSILLVILAIASATIYIYVDHDANKLPPNNPDNFLKNLKAQSTDNKIVFCAGDSNTHGRVCINYVNILEKRFNNKKFTFINGGINSELAYNLKQRIDTIAACRPAFITILIGSNDANGTLVETVSRRQVKKMKLPQRSDPKWFRENLSEICSTLKEKTDAKIALLTLPPIGEEINSEAYRRAAEFSSIIREVAAEQNVALLPLNRTMDKNLVKKLTPLKVRYKGPPDMVMYKALARHYLLGKSFDEISEDNGFLYLIDLLHINTRGAETVADLIENFLSGR